MHDGPSDADSRESIPLRREDKTSFFGKISNAAKSAAKGVTNVTKSAVTGVTNVTKSAAKGVTNVTKSAVTGVTSGGKYLGGRFVKIVGISEEDDEGEKADAEPQTEEQEFVS